MSDTLNLDALHVGPAEPEDAVGICVAVASAFDRDDEANLVIDLYREEAALLTLVVKLEDTILGAVVFSRVQLESDGGERAAVLLAPLAVAPPFQRCGVGRYLVSEGLARLKAAGEEVVLTVGDPAYYGRFGFSADVASPIETPWATPNCTVKGRVGSPGDHCRSSFSNLSSNMAPGPVSPAVRSPLSRGCWW